MKRSILLPKNTPSKVASKDKHIQCPASTTIQFIYFQVLIHTVQQTGLKHGSVSRTRMGSPKDTHPKTPGCKPAKKIDPITHCFIIQNEKNFTHTRIM
tara:strand:- start:38391 stop:38684 length:294 start_codon:yes stop_codon:yes gene_type:complete